MYASDFEVASNTMLPKCRLIILILFFEIILCIAEQIRESKSKIRNTKTVLDLTNNSTANTMKLNSQTGQTERFLTMHNPITCDGYILTIFRLTNKNTIPSKSPVLMAHGLYQSSDRWIQETKEKKSLAFKLQDLGFDVWLFNARGNKYSRQHINIASECDEKYQFFDYSYEEIGLMDMAASVDYILNITSFKKIHFVGHSIGGTEFLVLNALKPEYNVAFDKAFLLAPYGYHRHYRHASLRWFFQNNFKEAELKEEGTVEIFPYLCTKDEFKFAAEDCLGNKKYKKLCQDLNIKETLGLNSEINTKHSTRGGSTKQLVHLVQNILSGLFKRYQYSNATDNIKHYGEGSSPEYHLELVTVPTTIYYSRTDEYIHYYDIKEMAQKMPNATLREVAKGEFKHDDFVNSSHAIFFVYNGIIKSLTENALKSEKEPIKPEIQNKKPEKAPNGTVMTVLILAGIIICIGLGIVLVAWVTASKK